MRIDYSKHSWCKHCQITKPKELIRCNECSFRLRHGRHGKKQFSKFYNYTPTKKGGMTFPVQIRKLRVKRIMLGLNPNIPVS